MVVGRLVSALIGPSVSVHWPKEKLIPTVKAVAVFALMAKNQHRSPSLALARHKQKIISVSFWNLFLPNDSHGEVKKCFSSFLSCSIESNVKVFCKTGTTCHFLVRSALYCFLLNSNKCALCGIAARLMVSDFWMGSGLRQQGPKCLEAPITSPLPGVKCPMSGAIAPGMGFIYVIHYGVSCLTTSHSLLILGCVLDLPSVSSLHLWNKTFLFNQFFISQRAGYPSKFVDTIFGTHWKNRYADIYSKVLRCCGQRVQSNIIFFSLGIASAGDLQETDTPSRNSLSPVEILTLQWAQSYNGKATQHRSTFCLAFGFLLRTPRLFIFRNVH